MAIVGHFSSLAEAQKLVQSKLLAGVVQEIYEEGGIVSKLPVMTIDSKSLLYNRESTLPDADFYDIHEQIPWKADVSYATQVEVAIKRIARQDILDKFMMDTYKDPNDYRSIITSELRKGVSRTLEDKLIYGDATTYTKEFDGLDKLCAATSAHAFGTNQDYDMGGGATGLSIAVLKDCVDQCKPRPDILLMTRKMANKLSMAVTVTGIGSNIPLANITYGFDGFGKRIPYFDGVPIMITDYISNNENDNTGGKASTTTNCTSIYAIRFGTIPEGGLCLLTSGQSNKVEMFRLIELKDLEDYDADGLRLVAYCAMALGSTKAIARIHSIGVTTAITA